MRSIRAFALLTLGTLLGCASDAEPPPHPDDYDRSCSVQADCRIVVVDAFDCNCSCDTLAVLAQAGADAFEADQAAYVPEDCRSSTCDLGCPEPTTDVQVIDCVDGQCAFVDGPYLSYYD